MSDRGATRRLRLDRRTFVRLVSGASTVLLVPNVAFAGTLTASGESIVVTPTCVGCTGCIPVCPTAAIAVRPEGIRIEASACIGCGHCMAVCPVDGIQISSFSHAVPRAWPW